MRKDSKKSESHDIDDACIRDLCVYLWYYLLITTFIDKTGLVLFIESVVCLLSASVKSQSGTIKIHK